MNQQEAINILFVDDEQIIREGLALTVNWQAYHFYVMGTAANGEKALALCEKVAPDIVVTDIRMPIMDGLELTRELIRRFPNVKVIILSAYNEFQYAQKALTYGASEYLLKTDLDCDNLLAIALKLAKQIISARNEQRVSEHMLEKVQQHVIELQENFLLGLLTRMCYLPEAMRQLDDLQLRLQPSHLHLVHFTFQAQPIPPKELEPYLADQFTHLYFIHSSLSHLIVLCNHLTEPSSNADIVRRMEDIRLKFHCNIYYVNYLQSLENVFPSNSMIMEHIRFSEFYQMEGVFECEKAPPYSGDVRLRFALSDVVLNMEQNRIRESCSIITNTFYSLGESHLKPDEVKEFAYLMIGIMIDRAERTKLLLQHDIDAIINKQTGRASLRQLIYHSHHFTQLQDSTLIIVNEIAAIISENLYPYGKIVNSTIAYINGNIQQDLSLNHVAAKVFCSPVYLSQVFKKDTGKNFSEYVSFYRMQQAKLLLSTSELTVRQISERVGISNPSYFSKLFMKTTGVQPNKYRMDFQKEGLRRP